MTDEFLASAQRLGRAAVITSICDQLLGIREFRQDWPELFGLRRRALERGLVEAQYVAGLEGLHPAIVHENDELVTFVRERLAAQQETIE